MEMSLRTKILCYYYCPTVIGRAHRTEKVPKAAIQNEDCNPGNSVSPILPQPHHRFFISKNIKLSDPTNLPPAFVYIIKSSCSNEYFWHAEAVIQKHAFIHMQIHLILVEVPHNILSIRSLAIQSVYKHVVDSLLVPSCYEFYGKHSPSLHTLHGISTCTKEAHWILGLRITVLA